MNHLRQAALGVLAALLSIAIILGGLNLSMQEGGLRVALESTAAPAFLSTLEIGAATGTPVSTATFLPPSSTLAPGTPSLTPTVTSTQTATPTNTATQTLPPPPTSCPPPSGWSAVTVQAGDTLESLAESYATTPQALMQANCLVTESLIPGTILYVPGRSPTQPPVPCGPPYGWVFYTVQPGDTLYKISQMVGATIGQLQLANCMGSSTFIRVGQQLYVPYLPRPTATPVPPTSIPTLLPTSPAPTTPAPTTAAPTTAAPTTAVPTTAVPTTAVPTMPVPTTPVPTTAVPTTAVPTMPVVTSPP